MIFDFKFFRLTPRARAFKFILTAGYLGAPLAKRKKKKPKKKGLDQVGPSIFDTSYETIDFSANIRSLGSIFDVPILYLVLFYISSLYFHGRLIFFSHFLFFLVQ